MVKIENITLKYNPLGKYTNVFITYSINGRIEYSKGTVFHEDNEYKITYAHIVRLIYISLQHALHKEVYVEDVRTL